MKALLFNMHDVILLLTIGVCGLLGAVYFIVRSRSYHARLFLALFFFANVLAVFYTLIYWAEPIRHQVFGVFPYTYLILSAVSFMLGPLLYWHTCFCLHDQFRLRPVQCLHFLPVGLAPLYFYIVCFRFDLATQRDLFLNLGIYGQANAFYYEYISIEKIFPVVYGVICLLLIVRHFNAEAKRSTVGAYNNLGLIILISGFSAFWGWAALTHFLAQYLSSEITDFMGIAGNYFKLFLVLYLAYIQLLHLAILRAPEKLKEENLTLNQAHVDNILSAMAPDGAFLNPQLTLERFADIVGLAPREVSTVINRKFRQNFHEFINGYRLNHAKQLLRNSEQFALSIQDIAHASGFNSKATFNRFFKKFVLITPSDYRRKHQA
jgi:AraC-type DNA-binding domain-containing proteins